MNWGKVHKGMRSHQYRWSSAQDQMFSQTCVNDCLCAMFTDHIYFLIPEGVLWAGLNVQYDLFMICHAMSHFPPHIMSCHGSYLMDYEVMLIRDSFSYTEV